MTLTDTRLHSACLLRVRFSFVVLHLNIEHRILNYNCGSIMRSTSDWKFQTEYLQKIMHIVFTVVCNVCYIISTYTNVIQRVYHSPARGNWFDFRQKTNRNPIAASAQKSTRTGTYWSRAVDWIAATSASPWHGTAGIWHHCVVVSGTACIGILWKHLFSYGISKDQPKLVVLRDMDTEPWKDAFWTSV